MEIKHRLQLYAPVLLGILTSLIVLILINRDYPFAGHDYRFFIPRLIDTKLHLILNGLTIQWYTPSFGGGLPAYPNPQHVEYSILQFLTLFTNPWAAVLLSTFVVSLLGFLVFKRFLEHVVGFHWTTSTLGAIFFIGNGFYIEHMIAGHLGFQLFPLGAVILYAAANRDSFLRGGAIIALTTAIMIHQAGFNILIILGFSLLICLPLLYLYNREIFKPSLVLCKLAAGLGLAGILASSKIYAVISLMQLFPREVGELYPVSIAQGLMGIAAQLLGIMFLAPFLLLARQDLSLLSGALSNITGSHLGIWETDTGLSPVLTILVLFTLSRWLARRNQTLPKSLSASQAIAWTILIMGIWITTEFALAKGLFYPLIKSLPILRSIHVNVRLTAAFILPLILLGCVEYEKITTIRPRLKIFLITAVCALIFPLLYILVPSDVFSNYYDLTQAMQTDDAIHDGDRFTIERVANIEDDAVFLNHATNLLRYEALFSRYDRVRGYIIDDFAAQIQVRPGEVTDTDGAYFNMTNPVSLVFPKQNNLVPFERIKLSEEEQLQAFVQRRQPKWDLPKAQIVLNWVSLGAFILTIGLILLPVSFLRAKTATNKINKNTSAHNI